MRLLAIASGDPSGTVSGSQASVATGQGVVSFAPEDLAVWLGLDAAIHGFGRRPVVLEAKPTARFDGNRGDIPSRGGLVRRLGPPRRRPDRPLSEMGRGSASMLAVRLDCRYRSGNQGSIDFGPHR